MSAVVLAVPVTGVVAQAVEDDAVDRAAGGELLEGVGQLDLAAPARRGALQRVEDGRIEDGAADDRVGARRVPGRGLLDQPGDPDDTVLAGRFHGRATVEVDLLAGHLHERDHTAGVPVADVEHPAEQGLARVDQIVAEEDGEGLVPDVAAGAQHGVAQAQGSPCRMCGCRPAGPDRARRRDGPCRPWPRGPAPVHGRGRSGPRWPACAGR
jgi:CheY-like chemotaxis protein